ncbi:MAG: o-succinylbenzoate--CoA ligase [Chloroflexi bacterium]|uniref:2-succinylbenzoate--CoA ligase n=1 Tax=Candidatus Chlorohelix allophototropha TaxID=3003348 RepID=A0A8T7M7Q8_9CHLR|nr:o-succinylbenzoate--CoA ligase [Chloroflexota bacterium]WJW68032.1 o-succinylbenzoate--CoA ligase [Chloroflexota bacterium L227-S17]
MTQTSEQNLIPDWLKRRAESSAHNIALIFKDETLRWAELYDKALLYAGQMAAQGVEAGARVALLLGNTPAFVCAIHATAQLGVVVAPLNTRLTVAELGWQLQDVQPALLLYDAPNAAKAMELASYTICPILSLEELAATKPIAIQQTEYYAKDQTHSIIYSSGTTGKPKGVMLTCGNHLWNALASCLNLGLQQDDRWLAVLPLFHVGGMSILLRSVLYGIPVVLHESFDPATINRSITENRVTIISVVANMLQRMLDESGDSGYPSHLRCVLTGGGPVPRPLLERCAALNIPITQTYGMTETASQVATLSPVDALNKLGSAGRALYPSEIKILHKEVSHDGVGEILVRGAIVTAGYFNRPEETTQALAEGWLHTGDLGRLDEDGYLYVVDRRSDLIISGGENIYPAEIEAALLAHPTIEEAGVVGVPDERWGQIPVAVVKLRENTNVTEAGLIEWCSARLARYKVPKRIVFAESLSRNAAGKLVRRLLKDSLLKKTE